MRITPLALTGALVLAMAWSTQGCDDDDGPAAPQNDPPVVQLIAPNGGEVMAPGGTFTISWQAIDDNGITDVTLSYTADGVATPVQIVTGRPATGTHTWSLPAEKLYGVKVQVTVTDTGGLVSIDESDGVFAVVTASARGYVTSATCGDCHASTYANFRQSGHPYKINAVVNGQPPTYPFTSVPNPPTGFAWSDIRYVIGGYAWKARFIDSEGYVLTTGFNGGAPQYNLPRPDLGAPDPEWVTYNTSATRAPFTCGVCHTTGWQTDAQNGGVNQDGLPGIKGTWEEPGIQCEACHGPGATHVATKTAAAIQVDGSAENCAQCHYRDPNYRILASQTSIRHHEQYEELIAGPHAELACTACHDPHKGVRHGNAESGGIRQSCESCHGTPAINHPTGFASAPSCVDCHMGRATKNARFAGTYMADIRTHIFTINTEAVGLEAMFYDEDGKRYARNFVTLDYACYSCHKDEQGQGGNNSTRTLAQLSAAAQGMHAAGVTMDGITSSSSSQSSGLEE